MAKRRRAKIWLKFDARTASRLITFFGIFSAIVITVFVWAVYKPGRHTHERLLDERTRLRLTFQPTLVQDYLSSLAPGVTRLIGAVPRFTSMQARAFRVDWIHALPYEITFLLDQHAGDPLGVTLFVNPIPDNGSFVSEVNDWGAVGRLEPVRWQGARLASTGEQQFTAKGELPLPDTARDALEAWPKSGGSLYRFDGGHFIELDVENSEGILAALHAAMGDELWGWISNETDNGIAVLWPQIARVQMFGDIQRADELLVHLKLVGTSNIDRASAEATLNSAVLELSDYLSERAELSFSGEGAWTNSVTYDGTYRLTGFEARIHRIWRE